MGPTRTHTGTNRRRHPRADLGRQVQFYGNNRLLMVLVEDISEGGLSLRGVRDLRPGDSVKLFVRLPMPRGVRDKLCLLLGKVVWQRTEMAGIEFLDPPLESLLEVRGFVRSAA